VAWGDGKKEKATLDQVGIEGELEEILGET
jgi:hypothetical protein